MALKVRMMAALEAIGSVIGGRHKRSVSSAGVLS